nr:immunoglobulin heavy chain junction region [Mus musculus]
QHSLHAAQQPD